MTYVVAKLKSAKIPFLQKFSKKQGPTIFLYEKIQNLLSKTVKAKLALPTILVLFATKAGFSKFY